MQERIQVRLEDLANPDQVRREIESEVARLERFHDRITSVRVSITAPDKRHKTGGIYEVHITIEVPKHGDITVMQRAGDKPERALVNVAVREAFAEARRQLQDVARELRGDIKTHGSQDHGKIAKIFHDRDYGFIDCADGREIYFHRNSVVGAKFDNLSPGVEVRFVEADGENGPQASTVKLIGKHHLM
jgi:cold shock CspA family protein